jgi:hypothetical protein
LREPTSAGKKLTTEDDENGDENGDDDLVENGQPYILASSNR